ncbi:MAG: transglutaminase domain-containing protein [Melioribacteraceae bacterium]|nr:transglutaminase domain-containing protein [Melioribacteraceae bacterium]
MRLKLFLVTILISIAMNAQTKYLEINEEIENGNFSNACDLIDNIIAKENLSETEIYDLEFEKERMNRVRLDFRKTSEDVLTYLTKYFPDADQDFLKQFEKDNSLEHMIIDGEKFYFNRSHRNLFRINKKAKAEKEKIDGDYVDGLDVFLEKYIPQVVKKSEELADSLISPIKLKLNYTLTVDKNVVPDGEVIRCWMPYPREGHKRQTNIQFLSTNCDEYIIASNKNPQRTIYMEKRAIAGEKTLFNFEVSYVACAEYYEIDPDKVNDYNISSDEYKLYTSERLPHIMFSDRIKKISEKVVGDEKNSYLKAKKLFTWIHNNIPWAGAREYSTIKNIPEYSLENMHGDCGIKTLLFITLCRYNGIPAKWQSGWMLHPGNINLHDWGEIYVEGYGWIPVDQSFGITNVKEEEEAQYFFLGGMDAYRLIVNDDYSQPLFPAKVFPRSETIDFQRGEVEWKGGNLYFNKWDYHMDVEYIE